MIPLPPLEESSRFVDFDPFPLVKAHKISAHVYSHTAFRCVGKDSIFISLKLTYFISQVPILLGCLCACDCVWEFRCTRIFKQIFC